MPKLIMIHYPRTLHRSNLAISRTFASAPACQPARVGLTKPSGPRVPAKVGSFSFRFFSPSAVFRFGFFRWPQLCHHETLVACFCKLINISDPKHTSGQAQCAVRYHFHWKLAVHIPAGETSFFVLAFASAAINLCFITLTHRHSPHTGKSFVATALLNRGEVILAFEHRGYIYSAQSWTK